MATWVQGCQNTAGATTAVLTAGDYYWLAQKIPIWANGIIWHGGIYMSGSNSVMHGITNVLNNDVNAINWLNGPFTKSVSSGWNTLTRTGLSVSQGLDRYQVVRLHNPQTSSYTGYPYHSPDQSCDRSDYYNWRTTTSSWGLYSRDFLIRCQVAYADAIIEWHTSPTQNTPVTSHVFPNTYVGDCSSYINRYLKNVSNGPAKGSISITSQTHFDVSLGLGVYGDDWQPFLPGDVKQFRVRFCPQSPGLKQATVNASCTPNCSTASLTLSGTGLEDVYVYGEINFNQSTFYTGPFPTNSWEDIAVLAMRNIGNTGGRLYARLYEYPNTTDETLLDSKDCWAATNGTCLVYLEATTPSTGGNWPVGVKVRGADQSWPPWGTLGTAIWDA